MLVISRHKMEEIVIGDDIVINILDIRGDKVRIGIEAPRETSVHRREVYEAIKRQEAEARDVNVAQEALDAAQKLREERDGAS